MTDETAAVAGGAAVAGVVAGVVGAEGCARGDAGGISPGGAAFAEVDPGPVWDSGPVWPGCALVVDAVGIDAVAVDAVVDAASGVAGRPVSFAVGIGGVALSALAAVEAGAGVVACLAGGALPAAAGGVAAFAAGASCACACCRWWAKPGAGAAWLTPSPAAAPPGSPAADVIVAGAIADDATVNPGASVGDNGSGEAASGMRKPFRPAGTA